MLLTEPPLNTPENREYTAEIMFGESRAALLLFTCLLSSFLSPLVSLILATDLAGVVAVLLCRLNRDLQRSGSLHCRAGDDLFAFASALSSKTAGAAVWCGAAGGGTKN